MLRRDWMDILLLFVVDIVLIDLLMGFIYFILTFFLLFSIDLILVLMLCYVITNFKVIRNELKENLYDNYM